MPIDPQHVEFGDPGRRLQQDVGDLRRRADALERQPAVQVAGGPPGNTVRDGTLYVDSINLRLYVRVAGAWKWTGLS